MALKHELRRLKEEDLQKERERQKRLEVILFVFIHVCIKETKKAKNH